MSKTSFCKCFIANSSVITLSFRTRNLEKWTLSLGLVSLLVRELLNVNIASLILPFVFKTKKVLFAAVTN